MLRLKCRCGHKFNREKPEEGEKVECPHPDCANDGIWSDGGIDDFVRL